MQQLFKVEIKNSALKFLERIPQNDSRRIYEKIEKLADPEMHKYLDILKVHGEENSFRLRVGSYRVIYEKNQEILYIEVVKVGLRKDIYERM